MVIGKDSWQMAAPISVLHKCGNEGDSLCERFLLTLDRPAGPRETLGLLHTSMLPLLMVIDL